ncbi:MAG: ATP-binding protein [Candidatus Hodarchaeales archaeon]|jgi:two-component sensor histidine kinase/tetratricopeptide (TPR) repeat protein
MINNLKIVLKKQKRLIAIFILTIFLPSVVLSIFGIRAIRNDKFRLSQQFENEHRRITDFLKTKVNSQLKDIETVIQNLVQYPMFSDKDYQTIKELLINELVENNLLDQVFIIYKDEEPLFPLFQPVLEKRFLGSTLLLDDAQQKKLKSAEEYEFVQRDYKMAISFYNELFINLKDKNIQAQMLNHIARNSAKLTKYNQAIKIYSRIIDNYLESTTSFDLPLVLIAQLGIIDCYQESGESINALKKALHVYNEILRNSWDLSESQFKTYASIVNETITNMLSKISSAFSDKEECKYEFEQLKDIYQDRIEQWQIINDLKRECIPELDHILIQPETYIRRTFRHSKTIGNKDVLLSAVMIPDKDKKNSLGILGVKIKNDYIERDLLNNIIENIQFGENTNLTISNLSGRILYGKRAPSNEVSKITTFFEDNFPPWRIEISHIEAEGMRIINIHKSFYFWTILTLIIVLSFGVVLIVKTVAHEMEVLKIKSDFVSSVSHEFKTPLTSIKALIERLLKGKVKNPARMKQYFSVISQDTDRLTRLVGNILSFSKIEEGKKEYDFEETDITEWLDQTIEDFRKGSMQRGIKIQTQIPDNIPHLKIDRNALAQAVNNLLDNAIKFSLVKNEVNVIIKRDENHLIIKVKDYGIGIPQAELDKIFEKFYQGKNAIRYSVRGTGLGLTLVKHSVETHGGSISVESKVGQGSTFSLFLPIKCKN